MARKKAKHPTHLLQERIGQKPHVYIWTPVLAKKQGMRPITAEEAEEYLHPKEPLEVYEEEDEYEDSDSKILDSLKPNSDQVSPLDGEAKPLEVSQNDLLKKDLKAIGKLESTASIEEYILRKYDMTMIPMPEIEQMRDQAASMLEVLAATNSLH